jgi:glycerate 2-kinase
VCARGPVCQYRAAASFRGIVRVLGSGAASQIERRWRALVGKPRNSGAYGCVQANAPPASESNSAAGSRQCYSLAVPPGISTTRRVLIAFDKFKGALTAEQACDVAAGVLGRRRPRWQLDSAPLTDGGDGFCRILTQAGQGKLHTSLASGSRFDAAGPMEHVRAEFGSVLVEQLPLAVRRRLRLPQLDGARLGVLEMASVNGLSLGSHAPRDVWRQSSFGTGQLLLAASESGVQALLLGVGGSATSDLGLGALCALGLRFEAGDGVELRPPLPAAWPRLLRVRGAVNPALAPLRIACDVDNPLLGPRGAAAVYGPQKGLRAEDVPRFDAQAARVARLLCEHLGRDMALADTPGAGAAGGIAFGLLAAADAELVPGFQLVSDWLDLDARLTRADCVITGEGRFDTSSWSGKGPGAIAAKARALGRECVLFAGSIEAGADAAHCRAIAISEPGLPLEVAVAQTRENLTLSLERWLDGLGD